MTFMCKLCNDKKFETASGLWKHNNKHHKSNEINKNKIYYCTYCNKEYKHNQTKWTHEKNVKIYIIYHWLIKCNNLQKKLKNWKQNHVIL